MQALGGDCPQNIQCFQFICVDRGEFGMDFAESQSDYSIHTKLFSPRLNNPNDISLDCRCLLLMERGTFDLFGAVASGNVKM